MRLLYNKILFALFASLLIVSCSDSDLDVVSTKQKPVTEVKTLADIQSLVKGCLNYMTTTSYYGRNYIVLGETYADNTYANGNSGRFTNMYYGNLNDGDGDVSDTWEVLYQFISNANIIINKPITVGDDEKGEYNHLLGEAYFFRALAHFDLLKFFGQQNVDINNMNALGIPYETVFHPEGKDIAIPRNTVKEVFDMINKDLDVSIEKMDAKYDYPSTSYVNSWAAKALKVRVALYFKDYPTVIKYADEIINSQKFGIIGGEDYIKSWERKASKNWLFALANTPTDNRSINGLSNIYQDASYGDVEAREEVVTKLFSPTDLRGLPPMLVNKNGYRNYGKYPQNNPADYYIPIFRYEEILMSKAEALFYQNNDKIEALKLFNEVNKNRNAEEISDLNKEIIIKEWRKEFYFEGFRFHTLARNGLGFEVPNAKKSVPYGNFQYAFPIPRNQMNRNNNLVQNKGY